MTQGLQAGVPVVFRRMRPQWRDEVEILFSMIYAVWRGWRRGPPTGPSSPRC